MLLALALLFSAVPSAAAVIVTDQAGTAAAPTDIVSISAGYAMSAAVRADGSLWTWGNSYLSQSGANWGNYWSFDVRSQSLGVASGEYIEATPMMAFSNSTKTAVCSKQTTGSDLHGYYIPITAALKEDSSLWLWGGGRYGVLGDEQEYGSSWRPLKVMEEVISYDVSGYHSAAVTADGSLYMWGRNNYGQVGVQDTELVLKPVKVLDNVASIKMGTYFSVALKKDGSLWSWGSNSYGQLGNATTENTSVPTKVMDGVTDFACGSSYCLAIKNGELWAWGRNTSGELGIGNYDDQYSPVLNENFSNDIAAVDAGNAFSAAVLRNGDLYMWGANGSGQLGDKSTDSKTNPRRILKNVKQVALGVAFRAK